MNYQHPIRLPGIILVLIFCLLMTGSISAAPSPAVNPLGSYVQLSKLIASDGEISESFGHSVSVDGDTLVVGTYQDKIDDDTVGSAYVFQYSDGAWTEAAKLTASDRAHGDQFGYSVSISGDTIVVGSRSGDVDTNHNQGSAYVFVEPVGGWVGDLTEDAKLTASDGAALDTFGHAVSISGDNIVVGADSADSYRGSAYVFVKPAGGWTGDLTEDAKLTASDGADSDQFGCSVSIDGTTVVIGAWGENSSQGSAYVFGKPISGWAGDLTEDTKLTASDGESPDYFGYAVSVSGNTIVVGAYLDDTGASGETPPTNEGSAYVYEYAGTAWTQVAKLTASDAAKIDFFGFSVSISGDTILIGAYLDDVETSEGTNVKQGSAYVFKKPDGGWQDGYEDAKLTDDDGEATDYFGYSVSINGASLVVGAQDDNGIGQTYEGSVSVFTVAPTPTVSFLTTDLSQAESDGSSSMNFSVQASEPVFGDVLIGFSLAHGSSSAADFGTIPAFVTIPNGATSAVLSIPVVGDTDVEANETFTLTLTGVLSGNAILGTVVNASGTIENDDSDTVTDTTPPEIVSITADPSSGNFVAGQKITLIVTFSEPATLTGSIVITFNTGHTVVIPPFTNKTVVTVEFIIPDGFGNIFNTTAASPFDIISIVLPPGATLADSSGNSVSGGETGFTFPLPSGQNLGDNTSITIDPSVIDVGAACPDIAGLTVTSADGDAPEAPDYLCVIENQGRPTIVWRNDPRADWYNIWIGNGETTVLFDWYSKPEAIFANSNAVQAQCEGLTCTLKPDINPAAGSYEVWMQAWGTPTENVDDGLFSVGGPLAEAPAWNGGIVHEPNAGFTYSATPSGPATGLTATITNGEVTLSWKGAAGATWYNVWLGTAPTEWSTRVYVWALAEDLGCENGGTCTLTKNTKVISVGGALVFDLTAGEYIWYTQSWGPAGFNTGGIDGTSFVQAETFTVQ